MKKDLMGASLELMNLRRIWLKIKFPTMYHNSRRKSKGGLLLAAYSIDDAVRLEHMRNRMCQFMILNERCSLLASAKRVNVGVNSAQLPSKVIPSLDELTFEFLFPCSY
jgi:hypothetical protein